MSSASFEAYDIRATFTVTILLMLSFKRPALVEPIKKITPESVIRTRNAMMIRALMDNFM